jgi:hypothetical protein
MSDNDYHLAAESTLPQAEADAHRVADLAAREGFRTVSRRALRGMFEQAQRAAIKVEAAQ